MATCPTCGTTYEGIAFCPGDGAKLTAAAPANENDRVGTVMGDRYRILGKVGEGGMGEIFEAEHLYIHQRVALKILRRELGANTDAVQRLHREARSTSGIGHPNIVKILDFGHTENGSVYQAMEWLDGEPLDERIERADLPIALALEIAIQCCRGLVAAHASGVIHRDLKPANIFIVKDDEGRLVAKLLDFGIAKLADADSKLTRTGTLVGTPYYIAPEQALGEAVDHRADIYSMGVILYELFTGSVPFAGDSMMAVLHQHTAKPPTPPRERAPRREIPPVIETLVLTCLEKNPAHRYQTASELLAALEHVSESLALHSSPSPEALAPPGKPTSASSAGQTQLRPDGALPGGTRSAALMSQQPGQRADEAKRAAMPQREPPPGDSLDLPLQRDSRKVVAFVLLGLLSIVVVVAILLLREPGGQGASVSAADAAPLTVVADATIAGIAVDAASVEPKRPSWSTDGRAAGFAYRVTVTPSPVVAKAPFRIQLTLRETTGKLARALSGGAVTAALRFEYFKGHLRAGEMTATVSSEGELEGEFELALDGKFHVFVELYEGDTRLGKTKFDVCVGAVPGTPEADDSCPRMK